MKAVFPLWKKNTTQLINDFVQEEFKTLTCCVNDAYFNDEWVGKEINQEFIKDLPKNVDPCGENGEYHTYCYAGPIFKKKINIGIGEKIYRPLEVKNLKACTTEQTPTKGFWYCELNAI